MAGYHIKFINKGVLGHFSKITEEFNEFIDAHEQGSFVMELIELSDLIGAAISFYRTHGKESRWVNVHEVLMKEKSNTIMSFDDLVAKFNTLNANNPDFTDLANFILYIHHYVKQFNLTYKDLYKMHTITERAFLSGQRK